MSLRRPVLFTLAFLSGCGGESPKVGQLESAVSHATYTASVDVGGADCALCGRIGSTCLNGMTALAFADPLPQGWTARAVAVTLYGATCDALQVNISVDGNDLPVANTAKGMCACGGCQMLAFSNFDVAPPGTLPGWVAGGNNTLTLATAAKLCVAYATVDVTGDLGLSISPSDISLIGPAGLLTPSQMLFVKNAGGTDPLEIQSISVGGPDAASFTISGPMTPAMVAVGDTATFQIACTPMGAEKTADLILATQPTGTVAISLTCDVFVPHPIGDGCLTNDFCASGFCVDGVCCNQPCTDQCAVCNLFSNVGHCVAQTGKPVAPRMPCAGSDPCTGICDGNQTAECSYPYGVACSPAACSANQASMAPSCDGKGDCAAGATTVCEWGCMGDVCAPPPVDMAMTDDAASVDLAAPRGNDATGCNCRMGPSRPLPAPLMLTALSLLMASLIGARRHTAKRSKR